MLISDGWYSRHTYKRTDRRALACSLSWLSLANTFALEGDTKLGQYGVQTTVNVECARHSHRDCYLSSGAIVFESQREQHAVRRIKSSEGFANRSLELVTANGSIGSGLTAARYAVGVNLIGYEIFEASPRLLFVTAIRVLASRASVALTEMIQYEPAGDDDQPR